MEPQQVIEILQNAMKTACIISAPFLLSTLIIGLFISFLQTATQINEQTLSFIPKIISILIIFIIIGPWILNVMMQYMETTFYSIQNIDL